MNVRIYYEGSPRLQEGFAALFADVRDNLRRKRGSLRFIAGGATVMADFMDALRTHPNDQVLMLIDCEGPASDCTLSALQGRKEWKPPAGSTPDEMQVFRMIQVMEAWFLADRACLQKYYGGDFDPKKLKSNSKVEEIPKADAQTCLEEASRQTKKGKYHKTRHAPALLRTLDRTKLADASPEFKRLLERLQALAA